MIYAFDFDGVISNSAIGWAFFCRRAWKKIGRKNVLPLSLIKKYRAYIRDAQDSYGLLCLLYEKSQVTRDLVKKRKEKEMDEARKFADAFFQEKEIFIKKDMDKFCTDLYGVFRFIPPFLSELTKEDLYIVTSNKKSQIVDVLRRNNISIKQANILDSSVSKDKRILIGIIAKREKVSAKDILFIEDSVEHIKDVMPTGVRAALASWGFVLDEDIEEARKLGVKVLDKNDLTSLLSPVEFFDVIDKDNKVIGRAPRDECHKKGLLHRAIHIMIINAKGEFLLQKRSTKKDLYPGWWTSSASGHVGSGDSYDESAYRELKEELGIKTKLKPLLVTTKNYKGDGKRDRERIVFYIGRHNGPFKINEEEIDSVKFFSPKKIAVMLRKGKFTPGTVAVLKELRKRPELLKKLGLE